MEGTLYRLEKTTPQVHVLHIPGVGRFELFGMAKTYVEDTPDAMSCIEQLQSRNSVLPRDSPLITYVGKVELPADAVNNAAQMCRSFGPQGPAATQIRSSIEALERLLRR